MEINITKDNLKHYLSGYLPLVVDFWAPWCKPCKKLATTIEELASEYEGKVVIGKCNVDEQRELAAVYNVRNIPTILFFKNGKNIERLTGVRMKSELQVKINIL